MVVHRRPGEGGVAKVRARESIAHINTNQSRGTRSSNITPEKNTLSSSEFQRWRTHHTIDIKNSISATLDVNFHRLTPVPSPHRDAKVRRGPKRNKEHQRELTIHKKRYGGFWKIEDHSSLNEDSSRHIEQSVLKNETINNAERCRNNAGSNIDSQRSKRQ